MKNDLILLKESLEALVGVVQKAEQGTGSLDLLDCDIILDELRTAYKLVLRLSRPTADEAADDTKNDVATERIETLIKELKEDISQQFERRLDALEQRLETLPAGSAAQTDNHQLDTTPTEQEKTLDSTDAADMQDNAIASDEANTTDAIEWDNDDPSVFAPADLEAMPNNLTDSTQPTMEEAEANDNEQLFEEQHPTTEAPVETPHTEEASSPTLWDLLQNKQQSASPTHQEKPQPTQIETANTHTAPTKSTANTTETPNAATPSSKGASVFDFLHNIPSHNHSTEEPHTIAKHQPTEQPASTDAAQHTPTVTTAAQPTPTTTTAAQPAVAEPTSQTPSTKAGRTLGEVLGNQQLNVETRLEQQVQAHKIRDLQTAISISDKFKFINDLFHNDMKAYNHFIIKLNDTPDRDSALKILNETGNAFHWDLNSLSVKEFTAIFNRKF